jgi:hypothetical protein
MISTDKRQVRCLGHFVGDPLENLLAWARPDLNATVEGRYLFVPDEYPDAVGYTDGIFIVNGDTLEFLD